MCSSRTYLSLRYLAPRKSMYVPSVCTAEEHHFTVHAPAWTKVLVRAGTPNNESMVTVHAPAWTTVVVCAGTPRNASIVTVYAPAWTTVVVCAGTPHNKLRVTIPCTGVDDGGGVRRHTIRNYLQRVSPPYAGFS